MRILFACIYLAKYEFCRIFFSILFEKKSAEKYRKCFKNYSEISSKSRPLVFIYDSSTNSN